MELFVELIRIGGLAFALVTVAVIALVRGDVFTKKSVDLLIAEKDAQIKREQDRNAELWEIIRPTIGLVQGSLEKLEAAKLADGGGRRRRE